MAVAADTQPPPAPASLAHQAGRRFLAVFLLIGGISAGLISLAWLLANQTHQRDQATRNTQTIQTRLESRYAEWQRETEALATQITYNRMLDNGGGENRWDTLRAYINAQADGFRFDTLVITDRTGKVVFNQGDEGNETEAFPDLSKTFWYYSQRNQHLHRVPRAPIWLGLQGGHGTLYLFKAIDNQLLADLANPGIELHLGVEGIIRACSQGTQHIGKAIEEEHPAADTGSLVRRDLILGPENTRLHISQTLPQAVSPTQFAVVGLALVTVLGLTLYSVFGTWLSQLVARVQALSRAADRFGKNHQMDADIEAELSRAAGDPDEVGGLLLHMRALMQASQERDDESRAYLQTLNMLDEAVVELDPNGNLLRASPAWSTLMGPELTGEIHACFEPDDQASLRLQLAYLFSGEKNLITVRLRANTPQRKGSWLECRFVPVQTTDDGPISRVRGVLRDITQTYMQEKHISHMALHDTLTGLPNRVLLEDRIKVALRMATRDQTLVGLGFIDLDHFKNINDALGHKAGDQLLVAFANNLRKVLRTGDTLARWGGDEFVVLLPEMPNLEDIRHVASKLSQASREPVQIEEHSLPVTFSMGFTVFPDDGNDVDVLLSQADRAMFYAKAQGRNMVQFYFDMAQKGLGKKELYIQSRLSAAIDHGAIQAWFQPVVDARSRRPIGLEALARWHDPDLGWISPVTFIPMAESLGLIGELGSQVLGQTLTMGRQLLQSGHDLLLAVNISKRQLFMADCSDRLLRDTRSAGLDPARVMLEITESVAMSEVDYSEARLRALHEVGFQLAVDDFGVGYSSLSQLHQMPVDELKIDISFTRRVHTPQGARLIQAIVAMAQALHLHIVAEGVEDAATADILENMGVHAFQGYHFGKPMPAEEFVAWLESYTAVDS